MDKDKKSTPVGAPQNQLHGTTDDATCLSELLFGAIRTGRENALKRPKDPKVDRALRRLINEANMTDDFIINLGDGYFRPAEEDGYMLRQYLRAESHRAKEILEKIEKMEKAFYAKTKVRAYYRSADIYSRLCKKCVVG